MAAVADLTNSCLMVEIAEFFPSGALGWVVVIAKSLLQGSVSLPCTRGGRDTVATSAEGIGDADVTRVALGVRIAIPTARRISLHADIATRDPLIAIVFTGVRTGTHTYIRAPIVCVVSEGIVAGRYVASRGNDYGCNRNSRCSGGLGDSCA
jgi:hypothetical protein